jgi:hypothetical protein
MSDVREAIERVGARFDMPDGGWNDLSRRRRRARARRRFAAGALSLTVAAAGSLLAVRALSGSANPAPKTRILATWAAASTPTPTPATSTGTTCPAPSGEDSRPVVLSATSGAAGSSIEVSGRFGTEELWMQLWWNAGQIGPHIASPPWPPTGPPLTFQPAGPGPVVDLADVAGPGATGACSFHTRFTVPNVEPGTYQLRWVYGGEGHVTDRSQGGAFALLASVLTFRVTS